MVVLQACMSVYHLHSWCQQKPWRELDSPSAEVPDGCDTLCGCYIQTGVLWKSRGVQRMCMLLTAGPSPTSNPGFSANAPFLLWDPSESASLALESSHQKSEEVVGAMRAGCEQPGHELGSSSEQWAPFSAKSFFPAQ